MFSQRKRFYQRKSFYGVILVALLAFGFWVNQEPTTQGSDSLSKDPVIHTGEPIVSGSQSHSDTGKKSDNAPVFSDDLPEIVGPCYLIKETDGFIKVYFVDEAGGNQLIRTTDITFSLLSEGDQSLFRKGMVVDTEDELSELLQDFES